MSIIKSYKDDVFEIVIQQNENTSQYSVSLMKNNQPAEFQGNLDLDTAMEIYDYYWDKMLGNDLSYWNGVAE